MIKDRIIKMLPVVTREDGTIPTVAMALCIAQLKADK